MCGHGYGCAQGETREQDPLPRGQSEGIYILLPPCVLQRSNSVLEEEEPHPLSQPTIPSVVYVFCSILGFVFVFVFIDKVSFPAQYVAKNELCTLLPLPSKPGAADMYHYTWLQFCLSLLAYN